MINEAKRNDIIFLTIYLKKLVDKDFDNRLSQYGLTGQQGRILFFVFHSEREIHQNDIEKEYHLSKSTVSGLVKRMEKKGFINIEKHHPYAILHVSDKGKEVINDLKVHRKEAMSSLLKGISKEDQDYICKNLLKLIDNMEGGNK